MPAPQPTRLFHITAIANLPAILAAGALVSKNGGAAAGINYQNIAHAGAQGARAVRAVPNPPGGLVHDFVPFYFAPRSPMLYAINGGRVAGCPWRQVDIVHFETTVQNVTGTGRPMSSTTGTPRWPSARPTQTLLTWTPPWPGTC